MMQKVLPPPSCTLAGSRRPSLGRCPVVRGARSALDGPMGGARRARGMDSPDGFRAGTAAASAGTVPVIRHRQTCILVGILVILVVSGVSATLPQMISQGGREANWNCTYQFKIKQPTTILTRAGCSFVLHSIICMQLVLWLSTSLLLLLTIATCCTVC